MEKIDNYARRTLNNDEIELIIKNKKNAYAFIEGLSNNQLYIAI